MAFPTYLRHIYSYDAGSSSHAIGIPETAVDDLVLVFLGVQHHFASSTTMDAEWTKVGEWASTGGVGGATHGALFSRLVDGSESWSGSGGGTTNVQHATNAVPCTWTAIVISGASGNVEAAAAAVAGVPNPPSLTPSWGAKDTLWLASFALDLWTNWYSDPSGYTHIQHYRYPHLIDGVTQSTGYRAANTTSENPGAFSTDSADSVAWTVAVEPLAEPPPLPDPPPYEPPTPGGAILEIYTSEPGSARWGSALWGVDTWAVAGWQDVTPEAVNVEILWGSSRPELGILSKPDPASWAVDFYDRERTLDPANDESPYFGDLLPGLPVRLSHNGIVVKQGVMESLGFEHSREFGTQYTSYMRVTDVLSVLGNAQVPSDSTLSDTLYARARDAISAAGVTVTVLPDPPGGDPALAAWVTGQEYSALDWILDAAESVLHVPYVTNLGYLGFRPYATPLDRSRVLASPNLIGLQTIVQHNGVFSVASALNDPDTGVYTTREVTPKPRYGVREYRRDRVTPDPGDWALAVLRDRAVPGLRYVPGEVYPLTAADVTTYATIEAVERVGIVYLEASPALIEDVIVVGGRIAVTGKKDSEAIWSFTFEAAQTAPSPLVTEDMLDLLIRDDDPTEFLYPDG